MARGSKYHNIKMYEKYGVFTEAKQNGFIVIKKKKGNSVSFKKGKYVICFHFGEKGIHDLRRHLARIGYQFESLHKMCGCNHNLKKKRTSYQFKS